MMRIWMKLGTTRVTVAVIRSVRLPNLSPVFVVVSCAVICPATRTRFVDVYRLGARRNLSGRLPINLPINPVAIWK